MKEFEYLNKAFPLICNSIKNIFCKINEQKNKIEFTTLYVNLGKNGIIIKLDIISLLSTFKIHLPSAFEKPSIIINRHWFSEELKKVNTAIK